jgi:hypothetical protein
MHRGVLYSSGSLREIITVYRSKKSFSWYNVYYTVQCEVSYIFITLLYTVPTASKKFFTYNWNEICESYGTVYVYFFVSILNLNTLIGFKILNVTHVKLYLKGHSPEKN